MHVHSLHQYLIPTFKWCEVAHWWKVSRACCKVRRFYEHLNVSWRSTPEFLGCWFEIPILILNNNQRQLLDEKGTKQQPLVYPSALYGHGRSFCTCVESNGGKSMWKFDEFFVNLGGHQPPRGVRAYNSTNNHELDNTFIVTPRGMYLVVSYG